MLVDGAGLWFRAFHGVPDTITSPDGQAVNAVRGFTDMIASLVERLHPSRAAICLDLDWRPAFRVALLPSYKAHRVLEENSGDLGSVGPDVEDAPDLLAHQVPVILELMAAAGIATAGAEGLEADDVLGTLAAAERTDPVVVVSGDRDLLQVVADEPVPVRVLYVGRGLTKAELYGPAELAERYALPEHRPGPAYAELAALRGDPSDGLPGVAGIGEKGGATLLRTHGDLAALREAARTGAAGVGARARASLLAAEDYLDAAMPVVRVVTDADVHLSRDDDTLPAATVDDAALDALARRWGVESSVRRLRAALAAAAGA
ncbi:5'-3' exonuclease [Rhodococcus aerolatus]